MSCGENMLFVRLAKAVIRCVIFTVFPFIRREIEERHRDRERRLDSVLREVLSDVNANIVFAFDETDSERVAGMVRRRLALLMLSALVRIERIPGHEGALQKRHTQVDSTMRKEYRLIYLELFRKSSYGNLKKILEEMDEEQLAWFLQFIGAERVGGEFQLLSERKTSRP